MHRHEKIVSILGARTIRMLVCSVDGEHYGFEHEGQKCTVGLCPGRAIWKNVPLRR